MKTRKIILLSSCAVLLCICIIQGIKASYNPVKTITLEAVPDKITITGGTADVLLTSEGNNWYTGTSSFTASKSDVDSILKEIKEIKVLSSAGKTGNEVIDERYELNEGKAVLITAFKDGKEVRSIKLGKVSSTGSQSYITIDGSKEILLVQGNLHNIFMKSESDLRSKNVFSLDGEEISAVSFVLKEVQWGLEKIIPEEKGAVQWKGTGGASSADLDKNKTDSFIQQLTSLNVSKWIENEITLPENKEVYAVIKTSSSSITVDVYKYSEEQFICTCSATPYKFEISSYTAGRFTKDFKELTK